VVGWRGDLYGIQFRPASRRAARQLWPVDLSPAHVLCEPVALIEADLTAATQSDLVGSATVVARRDGTVHGIGLWFHSLLIPGHELGNPPGTADSSWCQVLLPLDQPISVDSGDELGLEVAAARDGSSWVWSVNGSATPVRHGSTDGRLGGPD
jgi:hypothetical protein